MLRRFAEGFAGTLDFVETERGMTLLEGGPPHTPVGGGHPRAFAGAGGGIHADTTGVALRVMEHVVLADPATWTEGSREGAILTWEEARERSGAAEDTGAPG